MEKQKNEREKNQCMSCERLGTSTTALFVCVECSDALCDNCHQYHKGNKFTSRHKIVLISDISELEKSLYFSKNDCPVHEREELKLFCVDHDVPCCSLCVSVKHRRCNEVVTLDHASQSFMSSDIAKNVQQTLGDIEKDVVVLMAQNKQYEESITTQCDTGIRDIDSYFAKLQVRIENVKQNLKDKLIKISNEKKDAVETNIIVLENLSTKVEKEKKVLNLSLQKASQVQLMLEIKNLKTKHELHKKTVSQIFENSLDYKFVFRCNHDFEKLTKLIETEACVKCEIRPNMIELVTVPTVKLKLKCTINTRYSIIDCFFSSEQLTVILDKKHTLCYYDVKGKNVLKWMPQYARNYGYLKNENYELEQMPQVDCGHSTGYLPTAIAEGDLGTIVVAYSNANTVQFLDQYGNPLNQTYISFEHVDSISMNRSQQLLIASDRANIGVFRKTGEKVVSFGSKGSKYLCINSIPRLYYVESNYIICRTLDGTQERTISMKCNREINGFTVNPNGQMIVSSTQNNTVSLLSETGSIIADILTANDGLSKPSRIHCSFDGKTLLVVHKDNTEILCFEIV